MLSTRSTTARCTPPGGMREKARNSRSEYEVSRKPRIARVSSEPASVPPKKNDTGTSSASPTRTSRPAPTRFTPFSYFCTCWNVTPSRLPSSVCDMPWAMRRARMRCPTSISCELVLLVLDFVLLSTQHPCDAPTCARAGLSGAVTGSDHRDFAFAHREVASGAAGYWGGKRAAEIRLLPRDAVFSDPVRTRCAL